MLGLLSKTRTLWSKISKSNIHLAIYTFTHGQEVAVDLNTRKTKLVLFDWCNNSGDIYGNMDGSVLEEKSSFKMLGSSLLNWIRALTLSLLLKLPPRKLEPWFILWSFFLLMKLFFISINLSYVFAQNTVAMLGRILLATI